MDRDPRPRTQQQSRAQQAGSGEEADVPPRPDPQPDRPELSPLGFDDEYPAESEYYDDEHFEPL